MNFIVGRLIKFLSEEDTFWVYSMLIETILPLDYFTHLIGVQTESKILKQQISDCLPLIDQKF